MAILVSLLAIGNLMAGPSSLDPSTSADKGTVTLTGGAKNLKIQWYSLEDAADKITVEVDDENLDVSHDLPNIWDIVRDPKGTSVQTGVDESLGIADTTGTSTSDDRFKTAKSNLISATKLRELQGGNEAAVIETNTTVGVISTRQQGIPDQTQENAIIRRPAAGGPDYRYHHRGQHRADSEGPWAGQ